MAEPLLSVSDSLAGKRILLTGCTGFLGKVTLSMLLHRYGEVLDRVWVLVRRGSSSSAEARFVEKVVRSEPFLPLRERLGERQAEEFVVGRCTVLDGDITDPLLGLSTRTPWGGSRARSTWWSTAPAWSPSTRRWRWA